MLNKKVAEAIGKGVTNILDEFTGQQSSQNYNAPQAQLPEYNNVEDIVSKANEYYNNKDYEKALSLYAEAAEQDNAYAQYRIGFCYLRGNRGEENDREVARWFRKAAEHRFAPAQYMLGLCH